MIIHLWYEEILKKEEFKMSFKKILLNTQHNKYN